VVPDILFTSKQKIFKETFKAEKGVREEIPPNVTTPSVLNPILKMKN